MRQGFKTASGQWLTVQGGFSIVELLIVIVIIGILATITFVAYTGIQASAGVAVLKSDLNQAQTQLELDRMNDGIYPATESGLPRSDGTNYEYTLTGNEYCLTASSEQAKTSFHLDSSIGNIEDGTCSGHVGYNGGEIAFDQPSDCPSGFIPVPGNSLFATDGGFCVMKYEAKNVGGIATSQADGAPWFSISQTDAMTASTAACSGCHLITEAEWMTITANVLSVPSNWSSGTVGSGYIYNGHVNNNPDSALAASSDDSDGLNGITGGTGGNSSSNNRRTLALTNGEIIWDLAGNLWEWTSQAQAMSNVGISGDSAFAYREWTNGSLSLGNLPSISRPSALASSPGLSSVTSWNSTNGIGLINANYADTSFRAFIRGGGWYNTSSAGVLTLLLSNAPSGTYTFFGFRVAR